MPKALPSFAFDNSYARDLPGFYAASRPAAVPGPQLLFLNRPLADELGLALSDHDDATLSELFSGNRMPEGATPIAQAYAGHQFGNLSPKLGDGRALLLGEVIDRQGQRRDIAFKGSGRTPFSRGGDGKAAVGPMLREVLMGEAMHALGIPTTRALAVAATGEPVQREQALPGAVLTRIAASHIRVGTFEYFAVRGEHERVRQLADYTIARHYPELADGEGRYLAFLHAVVDRQAALIAQWMGVGFIHGVMNTDNMSIAGETIDYGPCAFMETYAPHRAFSSIDSHGRYAYRNQPRIAQWNLARFAETLLPLLADDEQQSVAQATAAVNAFSEAYRTRWLAAMRAKLGLLTREEADDRGDADLAEEWLSLLEDHQVDFTQAWRQLTAAGGDLAAVRGIFPPSAALDDWLKRWQTRWQARCGAEDAAARIAAMERANPWLIPRNHRVEEALAAASVSGDLAPFEALLTALRHPFDVKPDHAHLAEPAAPEFTANYRTFCGT